MIIHTHFVKSLKTINYYLIDWNKNSILIIRECSHTFLYDLVCCCNVPFSSLLDNRRHWPGSIGGNWWFQCQWQQPGQSKVRFSIYITQTQWCTPVCSKIIESNETMPNENKHNDIEQNRQYIERKIYRSDTLKNTNI